MWKQSSKENIISDALYVQQKLNQIFYLDLLMLFFFLMVLSKAAASLVKISHFCHSAFIFVKTVKEFPRVNSRRQEYIIVTLSVHLLSTERVCCIKEYEVMHKNNAYQLIKKENELKL